MYNSIIIASTLFGYQANLTYSYRLKGFDDTWSEWTNRTEKEYTNLPEGKYTFEVKVRSNLGNESAVSAYAFTILPPWYASIWAKLFYLIVLGTAIYYFNKWQHKRFDKRQATAKEEQKRQLYISELELSKTESELVALRNEKLEADINFKNSELASSAMHLVKNGREALTYLQEIAAQCDQAVTEKIGLLISDIEMPDMDGYTLTAEVRLDPKLKPLHVILHTSLSGVFNQQMVQKVGADDFIAKFNPDELAESVRKWLHTE